MEVIAIAFFLLAFAIIFAPLLSFLIVVFAHFMRIYANRAIRRTDKKREKDPYYIDQYYKTNLELRDKAVEAEIAWTIMTVIIIILWCIVLGNTSAGHTFLRGLGLWVQENIRL